MLSTVNPSATPRSGQHERSVRWRRSVLRAALSREQAEDTAALLRVVSDGARIRLLSLIHNSVDGSARVTDLTEAMGVSQPTVSRHLKLMTEAGILHRRPEGREVWYSIDSGSLSSIADLLR
ncbi:MAG: metalloregulator ArsR/SmtB family transcription factor [Actinobacteria bacterium]|jgi:ArsR family transcriptional regulator|uniref:ArsR/SmtB family transcription factor n=1 Tax=Propionicimonas sp. T2.31MG-18 TaxID=3157620 RepID=UPI0036732446|nr:metalloregulator ArsR/SmtB family transcription factor [Actinomycetota bacterium]